MEQVTNPVHALNPSILLPCGVKIPNNQKSDRNSHVPTVDAPDLNRASGTDNDRRFSCSQKAIGIQNNLTTKTKLQAHIIDMLYCDVRTEGKSQSRFSCQSNKKEQMNQHELSFYLLTRFGGACPVRDFY